MSRLNLWHSQSICFFWFPLKLSAPLVSWLEEWGWEEMEQSALFLKKIIVQLCYQRKTQLSSSRVKSGGRVYGNTLEIISTQIPKVSSPLSALTTFTNIYIGKLAQVSALIEEVFLLSKLFYLKIVLVWNSDQLKNTMGASHRFEELEIWGKINRYASHFLGFK